MNIVPVLLWVAVTLLLSSSFSSAQTQCGFGPYNLTALTTTDLLLNNTAQGGAAYAIRPCGAVTTPGYCGTASKPYSFCMGTTGIAYYNTSAVGNPLSDYSLYGTDNAAYWGYITRGGQPGIAQFIQDGANCGNGDYAGTIEFICNPSATTAYLSDVLTGTGCNLEAVVYTNLVCGVTLAQVQAANVPILSTSQCGGGIYDLSSLTTKDLTFTYASGSGFAFRPCGTISSITACSGLMACQYSTVNPTFSNQTNTLSYWQPYQTPVFYANLGAGVGVAQFIQDGNACGGEERLVNISYICNATLTTAAITSFAESTTCHYQITVGTPILCSQTVNSVAPVATTSSTCGNSLYNLNSITNYTLTTFVSGTHWAVRPCGFITDMGYCPGQVCQGTTVVNQYIVNGAQTANNYQTVTGSYSVPIWATASLNGQTGVVQTLQTGANCGSGTGARQANVFYMCNSSATVPFISSVLHEAPVCHYGLVVQTAAACGVSTALTQAVGQTVSSEVCGGGIYNLSGLTADITGSFGGSFYTINLCSNITTPAALTGCGADNQAFSQLVYYSACQYRSDGGGTGLAYYPAQAPLPNNLQVFWTWLGAGVGVQQYIQDGFGDCSGTSEERAVNVTLLCNSSATVPYMSSQVESPECHYNIIVQTNAVCGSPLFAAPGTSSSSSGLPVVTVSSSSAASVATSLSVVSAVAASSSAAASTAVAHASSSPTAVAPATSSPTAVAPALSSPTSVSTPHSSSASTAVPTSAPASVTSLAPSVTSATSNVSPAPVSATSSSSSSSVLLPPPGNEATAVRLSGLVVAVMAVASAALLL